ncbi:MAG: RHS repeat-associated core domain-containing protein [Treponema sp.]|nr:RHS repeat-associated core domain-containing protein [Treponema sp.]
MLAVTPPPNSGYWDWVNGNDPTSYYNPEDGTISGNNSGSQDTGGQNESGAGNSGSGGTVNGSGSQSGSGSGTGSGSQGTGKEGQNNEESGSGIEEPGENESGSGLGENKDKEDEKEKERKRRVKAAQEALKNADLILDKYDNLYNQEKAKFYNEHKDEIRMALDQKAAAEALLKSQATIDSLPVSTVGDPVFITNGTFRIDDIDESFVYGISEYDLTRKLCSTEYPDGSFGKNWFTSLDSRVVWGKSSSGLEERKEIRNSLSLELNSLCEIIRDGGIDPNASSSILYLRSLVNALNDEISVMEENLRTVTEKNKYTEYGMNQIVDELPADCFVLIDEDGSQNVFQYVGEVRQYVLCGDKSKWAETVEDELEICYLDGTKKHFDMWGQLIKIQDRYNSSIQFEYNAPVAGRRSVKAIKHREKKILSFEYNESNKIISVSNTRSGKKRTYSYDGNNNLTEMIYDGKIFRFAYDDDGDIVKIIKPDGSYIGIKYSIEGDSGKKRVSNVKDESGATETFNGNYSEGKMTYTDADGNTYHYAFSGGNITMQEMPDGTTVTRTYLQDGKVSSKTDEYGTINYSYDDYGNMVLASYSDGSEELWEYKQPFNLVALYKDRDGIITKYEYDENGSLVKVLRNDVCVQRFEYNGAGQIVAAEGMYADNRYTYEAETYLLVSDKTGKYSYNSNGKFDSYVTNDGRRWTYSYSADGSRVSVTSPEKLLSVYEYNNREDLVSVLETDLNDGNTRFYRYEYDQRHLLERVYSGYGKNAAEAKRNEVLSVSYEYTAGGKTASVIYWNKGDAVDQDGAGIKYSYKYKDGLPESYECCFVDNKGNAAGEIFRRKIRQCFIDGNKKIIYVDENGNSSYAIYDRDGNMMESGGPDGWKIKNEYSAGGYLVQQKNMAGGILHYEYDKISGQISSVQMGEVEREKYEYDDYGKLIHSVTENGFIQDYLYQENDGKKKVEVISNRGKKEITSDLYGRTQFCSISDEHENVISEQRIEYKDNGLVEAQNGDEKQAVKLNVWGEVIYEMETGNSYQYDQDGKCIEIQSIDAPVYISYNAFGLVSKIKQGNRFQKYYYNAKANVIKIEDGLGLYAEYKYDPTGQNLIQAKERGMPEKKYEYDKENRVKKYYESGELVMSYSYDDESGMTRFTDAKGNSYVQKTDGYGRMVQETNRSGKIRSVEYDDEDGVMKVTDFNGQTYKVTQSGALNAYVIQYQDGSSEKTFFNAAGSIVRTESNGISETFNYNMGQRLSEFRFRDKSLYNSYDSLGRRVSLETEDEKLEYEYDGKNRVISINGLDYHIDIFYDEFGNEILIQDSSESKTEFKYDEIGRLISTAGYDAYGALIFLEALVYDEDGKIACSINEEGFIKVFEYDGRGRVKKVQLPYTRELEENFARQLEECGKTAKEYSRQKIQLSPELRNACEDVLEKSGLSRFRLNCDNPVWTQEYEYDANGNRTKCTAPTGTLEYEYDAENRLVKINGNKAVTFQYDANGNLISQKSILGEKKWSYGQNNRPLKFESIGVDGTKTSEEYRYDALGRRVITDGSATLYDGLDMNPLYEWQYSAQGYEKSFADNSMAGSVRFRSVGINEDNISAACDFDRFYIYANGKLLGQRNRNYSYSSGVSSGLYSFMSDMRNSIGAVIDCNGNKVGKMTYDMDGTMFFSDARKVSQDIGFASTLGLDHGFVGKKYDAVAEAYNFGFRDYTPNTATFTTEDPIRDGMNWYSYCSGDPVNFVDLWGLENNSIYRMGMPSEYWNVDPEDIEFVVLRDTRSYDISENRNTPKNYYLDIAFLKNKVTGETVVFKYVQSVANYPSTDGYGKHVEPCYNDTLAPGDFEVKLFTNTSIAKGPASILINGETLDGRKVDSNGYTEKPLSDGRGLVHSNRENSNKATKDYNVPRSKQCIILPYEDDIRYHDTVRRWGMKQDDVIAGVIYDFDNSRKINKEKLK